MAFRRRRREEDPDPERSPFPHDASGEELRNSALVEAMRNVSVSDTPETRAMLYQLLLDSTLVVATPPTATVPTTWTAQAGDKLALVTTQDENGTVLPVFTSVDTLLAWTREPAVYAALPAQGLFEMAVAGGTKTISIDPGSPTRGFMTSREIEALARGRLPLGTTEVVAAATRVRIGRPAQLPAPDVVDAVKGAVRASGRVDGAWLYLMQQGVSEPEVVIGLRLVPATDGDADAVVRSIVDEAVRRSAGAKGLLFIRAETELAATLASGAGIDLLHGEPG